MIRDRQIEIKAGGVRLDAALLSTFPTSTRAFVRDAIERRDILIANSPGSPPRAATKGQKLQGGERLIVKELLEAADNLVAPAMEGARDCGGGPREIYIDDALLGYDKPAGMPVQPLSCRETGTLMNFVVAAHPECRPLGDRPLMAGALHRIDADTSGLVLVARSATAFERLRGQFSAQTVKKTYLALVEGAVAAGGTLENDLVHDPTLPFCRMIDIRRVRVAKDLKPLHAVTRYIPIARTTVGNEERTLLEVTIHTGVTHQIRAQLAIAGLHIVNDRLYGGFAVENQVGHCLHALAAEFRHPISGELTTVRTERPDWARL